ncbi:hypothetical protein [Actinomadura sp. DC4]|uniref:hypothetical protein n=1 Tax=Actinomadura sp. DC4 TaxID=3055069 RepID=UPI0025AEE23E|nr:hypothetical protein [Actinomadura sp. DC4]MDN3357297.1 hypothetical protein [Actinomadura sp. DC4]
MWRKASRSAHGPGACVEAGAAVLEPDRTLWMLAPGTGTRAAPLGRLAPSGRFEAAAPAAGAPLGRAYARARREFGLPASYRFTPSHADAMERLTTLASNGGSRALDWPAFARQVNRSLLARGGDLPVLLSAARLTRDVHGTEFTVEQLRKVRRLADAVRADTTVLARTGRAPGNEVRLDDLYAVIRTFPGVEGEVTAEDTRTLAGLVAGTAGIDALRDAWSAGARALRDDAAVALNQAMLAASGLGPALAVLGPDAAAGLDAPFGRLSEIVDGPWRPNLQERVEAARAALGEIETGVGEIYDAAVGALDQRVGALLADAPEPLRERFAAVDRAAGAAAVDDLLAIGVEAAAPPPDAPATTGDDQVRRARRLPGRVLFEAARNGRVIPWGEWGHVARVGAARPGADRALAEQATALLPEDRRPAVTDALVAEFERLGAAEAGRRLASAGGIRVPGATVRLALGPLTGAVYRRPEEVQSVQVGARPSQALDLPQIMTPSTYTEFTDSRSIAPETAGDGLMSIATGRWWMPSVGVLPTLTGRGSRTFGAYEGAVNASVQQIWHDRYAFFDVPGSRWSVTLTGGDGTERLATSPVGVTLAFAEDESPEDSGPPPETPMVAELPASPPAEMAEAFHGVLRRVTTIVESLVTDGGPGAAAAEITRRFPGADAAFGDSVSDVFAEPSLFAVAQHVLGHGYLSGEFRVNPQSEQWAALRLRGRVTSVRRVDTAHGYVQQDARHLFWSGESSGMSGGVSSGVQFAPNFPTFTVRGTPLTIGPIFSFSPGGSVNRSLAASMGAGDWRYLGYPSQRRVYRLAIDLGADVRSSRSSAAGAVPLAMIGYVAVPEREADRFERELRAVLDGFDPYGTGNALPVDGRHLTDRTPPLGILTGGSRGASVLDLLGGFERVISATMGQIDGAFGDARLATYAGPLTARQRHRLERALTQRFSLAAALPYTSQLISHRMSYTRLYQTNGGRLRLTVRVRSEQGTEWTGDRIEWGRIDHYPISYSDLGAAEEAAAQWATRGGGHIRVGPLNIRLHSANFPVQYAYGRSSSSALTARAGVWSSLGFVYEGPVRLFTFGTRFHVEVQLTFEPELASGGTVTGAVTGAVRRLFSGLPDPVARTVAHRGTVPGLMRYAVAEGLSPLAGGDTVPRPLPNLGAPVVRRRPITGPEQWDGVLGTPETLRSDDQPLEVFGVADLRRVVAELLDEAGVPERTYADTLDVTVNEDQLIGRLMWGGTTVQASGLVHGGEVGDRHAVVALRGRAYDLQRQAGVVRMRETDIMDSEPAVIFTGRRSTSHTVSGGADFAGTREDGGPYGSWTYRNVAETRIDSNEVLSGRWLTQEDRDYRPHRGTMLWDVTVTSWSANAAGTWSVRQDSVQVLVVGGIMVLRPAPHERVERPLHVPQWLPPSLIPLVSTSDRLDWPGLQHPPDGLNPVLDMVRGVLGVVDRRLLHRQWTIVDGTPTASYTGLPASLHTILERSALLGHRDTLLGPGLVLHLARSLPGMNEQVSLVLRADFVEGEDYAYDDTRARDFAVYRLNTQRRVARRGTTSAHSAGASTGTTRIPPVSRAVAGDYLEGVAESDFYAQATNAQGEIFRTRDVLTILGDTHAYTGRLRISATVYRGYNPSKALQVITLGLANSGFALLTDPGTPVPVAVTDHVDVVERVQVPVAMLLSPPAPIDRRVGPAAAAPTPEQVLANAGRTVLPVGRDLILSRGVVPGGIDPLSLRALFDRSIAVFNGTAASSSVRNLMGATGVPFEAYAALLSRHQFLSGFHTSLGDGQVFPAFVREDGPATDVRGELSVQARFYDPRPLGWVDARLTSESLHMAENDLLDSAGSTFGLSMDGGPALAPASGNPYVPVEPSGYLGQSHDHGGTAGERLVRPIVFRRRTHYLRVSVGVLAGLTISAVNQRRFVRYGAGQDRQWYTMDESLEVLVDPETALALRMLDGSTGIPTPHGRYLPHVPATAPANGAEELGRLRAAFALPRYGDWYPIAGHYGAEGVVLTAVRYDPAARTTEPVTERLDAAGFAGLLRGLDDLGDRPVVLVMGGVDEAFAAEVARLSGHDILATTDGVSQDASVRAADPDGRPGRWRHFPADGAAPAVHGADLGEVLTAEVVPSLRGVRAEDPPGTMTSESAVLWTAGPVIAWKGSSHSDGTACVEVGMRKAPLPQ